jgi:hypothetical protein
MEKRSEQFLLKRKFLLMLPVLILPFMLLAFWALGGGKGDGYAGKTAQGGINTSLPGAKFTDTRLKDKFTLYEQHKVDSAGVKEAGSFVKGLGFDTAKIFGNKGLTKPSAADANEAKIHQKLAEIRKTIAEPDKNAAAPVRQPADQGPVVEDAETERLGKIMEQLKSNGSAPDPELAQLSGMLDKIWQIQNPESVKAQQPIKPVVSDPAFKTIPAEIDGNQKVLPGGLVKLRLADSVRVNGRLFLKGQSLSGSCRVTNQRLLLDIKTIRLGTSIIPVSLTVFSLDGLAGIDAPEAELGEAAGGGAANALNSMEFLGVDQSVGMQAATAGISAAKGLLSKKVRKLRIRLKGGQTVLLKINRN